MPLHGLCLRFTIRDCSEEPDGGGQTALSKCGPHVHSPRLSVVDRVQVQPDSEVLVVVWASAEGEGELSDVSSDEDGDFVEFFFTSEHHVHQ